RHEGRTAPDLEPAAEWLVDEESSRRHLRRAAMHLLDPVAHLVGVRWCVDADVVGRVHARRTVSPDRRCRARRAVAALAATATARHHQRERGGERAEAPHDAAALATNSWNRAWTTTGVTSASPA